MDDTERKIANAHALYRACDVLAAHCKFTSEELDAGQDAMESVASRDEHDEWEEGRAAFCASRGLPFYPRPFIPPLNDITVGAYAMGVRMIHREAWVNEPTLEAKLAMLGIVTDNPQALADHLALLEISVRGEFANQKH